jgi:hypothetical protein
MAYTNPRGLGTSDAGALVTTLCAYTLADYTSAGTQDPAVDDIVTLSSTGNHFVKMAPDNTTKRLGRVTRIDNKITGTATGHITVEWLDINRFVECDTDDLSTVTLGNSLIKDGDTTVENNFDAGATTGNIVAWAKSGTSGAGTVLGAVVCL